MERAGTLINKLKEQLEQGADAEKLSVTARLLLCELEHMQSPVAGPRGKVSVVLPSFSRAANAIENTSAPVVEVKPVITEVKPVVAEVKKPAVRAAEVKIAGPVAVAESPLNAEPNAWLYEAQAEIPTLAHQEEKEVFELNEMMVSANGSLNEKLREEREEVATALQSAPVRDLKKAIGINDRYLFVSDLFRGDENMYERSMKTINSFSIYAEAQYWIQRELKVKMSWKDNSETVKLFDQLVKRRFS